MDHCQPEQAIEPSAVSHDDPLETSGTSISSASHPSNSDEENREMVTINGDPSEQNAGDRQRKRNMFIPVHESSRQNNNKRKREQEIESSLNKLVTILEKDTTNELIDILKEDSERQKAQDEKFMEMMQSVINMNNNQMFLSNLLQNNNPMPSLPYNVLSFPPNNTQG